VTNRPAIVDGVHFVSYGSKGGEFPQACYAAIVTEVDPPEPGTDDIVIGVKVLKPWGDENHRGVSNDNGHDPTAAGQEPTDLCRGLDYPGGTWHWPY
jgi:hypothetical protein